MTMNPYLFLLLLALGISQPGISQEVFVDAQLGGCKENLSLLQFDGSKFYAVQSAEEIAEGHYQLRLPKGEAEFYYIGTSRSNMLPLLLGQEDTVRLRGNCQKMRSAQIEGSPINTAYQSLKAEIAALKQEGYTLIRQYQAQPDSAGKAAVVDKLWALDEKKLALLERAGQEHPLFEPIVRLNTYLSYHNNAEGYGNEIEYYASEYFGMVDFSKPVYGKLPWVYEGFREYATTLASIGLNAKRQQLYIDRALSDVKPGTPVHKLALSGIIAGLKQKSSGSFQYYAKQFIEAYKTQDVEAAASMQAEIDRMAALQEGGQAPDFSQATPDGAAVSLSDFRGKVVLVDFWASWCGPCRRENPNVVKLYEKYRAEGFEILGVSLDRKKDRWLQAIEADGLTWTQVSDLKGWRNEVAQLYGVRSIPYTVLIDQEGRIIARRLRGDALERKLAELFGE